MVRTSELLDIDAKLGKERTKSVVDAIPIEHSVVLQTPAHVLDCSSDGKTLAVFTPVSGDSGQIDVLMYDVQGFADKVIDS